MTEQPFSEPHLFGALDFIGTTLQGVDSIEGKNPLDITELSSHFKFCVSGSNVNLYVLYIALRCVDQKFRLCKTEFQKCLDFFPGWLADQPL